RTQLVSNGFGHLTLDRKDVGQFAIEGFGPQMGIVSGFDQLHVHAHSVAAPLHASFQDVSNPKLLADLGQVFRRTFVMLSEVREITFKSAILDKRVKISSWMPSVKQAFALSSLRFSKGKTAMERSI